MTPAPAPPSRAHARRFGVDAEPVRLAGGVDGAWRAASIVLKRAGMPAEARWIGEAISTTSFPPAVRVARPVCSTGGRWIEDGFRAFAWVDGAALPDRMHEKLAAVRAFHAALAGLGRPDYFDVRDDPWARADRLAWGEARAAYDDAFAALLAPFRSELAPIDLPSQVVHGDLAGNIVLADGLAPGIIDLTLYWRPAAFAEAVLLLDLIWEEGGPADPAAFGSAPAFRQCLLRAILRRIAEQPEQVRDGKPRTVALATARGVAEGGAALLARLG